MNYYDIFVRNAFGNYRDVLREVSYSPVMGSMLTYVDSKSLSASGFVADENYAREIMQLFTIGLWRLNADGTRAVGSDGGSIPTYDNSHIVSFAKVFLRSSTSLGTTPSSTISSNREEIGNHRGAVS